MKGTENPNSIYYQETKGSAQCKTSIMFAALKSNGITKIKAKMDPGSVGGGIPCAEFYKS